MLRVSLTEFVATTAAADAMPDFPLASRGPPSLGSAVFEFGVSVTPFGTLLLLALF